MPAEVEIPTGFCSGMELPVTGFDGQTYAVSIPPGLQAGMTFRTELPARMSTRSMDFFVPKGFTTGTTIQVKGPDGQMHRTLVPDELAADRLLSIQIPYVCAVHSSWKSQGLGRLPINRCEGIASGKVDAFDVDVRT